MKAFPQVIQICPAPDWRARWVDTNSWETWDEALVGWGLRDDGEIEVLGVDWSGDVQDERNNENLLAVWHVKYPPDEGMIKEKIAALKVKHKKPAA